MKDESRGGKEGERGSKRGGRKGGGKGEGDVREVYGAKNRRTRGGCIV